MCRTRAQPGTAPEDAYRPGMFVGSYRAVPVHPYLGACAAPLKGVGERLHPRRQPLQRLGDRRVGRRRDRIGDAGAGADLLDVVGDEQGGEQQLAGFGQAAEGCRRRPAPAGRPRRRPSGDALPRRRGRRRCSGGRRPRCRYWPSAPRLRLEQSVDLADRAFDSSSSKLVGVADALDVGRRVGGRPPCGRALDARQRPLDAADGVKSALVGHGRRHSMTGACGKPQVDPRLTGAPSPIKEPQRRRRASAPGSSRRSLMAVDPYLLANAIRALSMDAVEAANSGHPGMPMGMADVATVLLDRLSQARSRRPRMARPRPLRPLGRPRLDADLRAAPPHRL